MGMKGVARDSFSAGVRAAAPIAVGYLPAAVAFGMAARQTGLSVAEAVLMSVIVYAGASQFALTGMIGAGLPGPAAALAGLAINVRHLLYGPALAPVMPPMGGGGLALSAFGLTDEVFAVASALLPGRPASRYWLLGLEAAAYGAWVGGTWLGAAGGGALAARFPAAAAAMSFALPALFAALLTPLLAGNGRSGRRREAAALRASAAAGAAVAVVSWLGGWQRWGVLAAGLAGPLVGWAWWRRPAGGGSGGRP